MTMADQLQMFEPEGDKLAELVQLRNRTAVAEFRLAETLDLSGFHSAASSRRAMAIEATQSAYTFEMALQFERLAGLA